MVTPFDEMKVKLYSASLGAIRVNDDTDKETGADWEHNSVIFTAPDMESARTSCEIVAFASWPPNEGWSHHSVAITEVTASFIREAWILHQQGFLIEDNPEPDQFFNLEPPDTPAN